MQKVKLPRDVAEAIDYAREQLNWSHANILVRTCRKDWESFEMTPIADFCTNDNKRFVIAEALVNGYEIEETPEEQAIQWMIKKKCLSPGFSEHDIVMAIKSILQRGVNDHE